MKPTLFAALFALTTLISLSGSAQIHNITSNTNSSSLAYFPSCSGCTFNISSGVTLTINANATCTKCTFNGGTVNISSGTLNLASVDSFKNETVLINNSFSDSSLVFYGDTVAVKTAMTLSGARTAFDSSRVSVNSALTIANPYFYKDSLHLNNNLTLSNGVDSFTNSHIDVATGVTVTTAQTNVINSTFAFAGSATMTVNYGLNSSGSNYYLAGTSNINSINATTLSGDNLVLSGTSANFTSGNALTTTNTNINLTGSGNQLTAQSLTTTGGSITATTGSTISSTYAISLTNTPTTLTGTTFGGSQLTTSGGSFSATNSPVSSTYAISLTNTPTTISGSSFSGSQLTTSGGSFSASGTTVSSTYAVSFTNTPTSFTNSTFTGSALTTSGGTLTLNNTNTTLTYAASVSGTPVNMIGNSSLTAQSLSLTSGAWFAIGNGTLGTSTTSAHVNLTYSASEDATSTLAIANNNNYLQSSATGSVSCGGAAPQHACATGYIFGCATIKNGASPVGCTLLALASINLSAAVAGPGQVALTWTDNETATAADHYSIQRSTGNSEWSDIGTVAAGSASGDYYFTDASAPTGSIDYRIQRTDADGNISFSAVASVTLALAKSSISIYPNPAIGGHFYINTPYTGEMVVNVYTSTGQLLLHTSLQGQTQYSIQLPALNLSLSAVVVQTISQNGNGAFTVLVR